MQERSFEQYDVCIVGASISGNYLAYLLSKLNLRIVVLEDHKEIGLPFQCAGIISQKLSKLIDLPSEIVLNRVNTAKLVSPSGNFIKLSGNEHPYVINRIKLDTLFYNKVKNNSNVTYYLGERYKSFEYRIDDGKKYVIIETSKRNVIAKMLIGCDGPLSLVGKQLNVKNNVIFASQIRIKAKFSNHEAAMYFNHQWKQLFGWIVPEGNHIYRIGIASANNVNKSFKRFLNELSVDMKDKIDQQGGIIPYGVMNKLAFDNVLLLGDAAGQVKATTGGGIVMLLTAAKYASNCIHRCFEEENFSKRIIQKYYEKPCSQTIGRELKLHFIIRLILENFNENNFEIFFKIIKENKIEHLITFYGDMDFPKTLVFKLLRNRTVLGFMFKFFIKSPVLIFKILKLYI
ncbi:MAG: geranylgeranyl reductase family protein [Promethearchaeota archaeon]